MKGVDLAFIQLAAVGIDERCREDCLDSYLVIEPLVVRLARPTKLWCRLFGESIDGPMADLSISRAGHGRTNIFKTAFENDCIQWEHHLPLADFFVLPM